MNTFQLLYDHVATEQGLMHLSSEHSEMVDMNSSNQKDGNKPAFCSLARQITARHYAVLCYLQKKKKVQWDFLNGRGFNKAASFIPPSIKTLDLLYLIKQPDSVAHHLATLPWLTRCKQRSTL